MRSGSLEVLVELAVSRIDGRSGAEHARPERLREAFEVVLGLGVEVDAGEPAIGRRDEQRPDRGVDHVEADVEQVLVSRGLAEAAVELWGNGVGHAVLSWRSRRTPDEAAWRAASGVEPSASAMSS